MTLDDAARTLKRMHQEGLAKREAKTYIHLFGLRYAEDIEGLSHEAIAVRAGVPKSYGTEIYSGVKLARYVQEKA